jgi:ABC-type multidrug transport system fused ATPase/permease subunit
MSQNNDKHNNNPLAAYIIASHLTFVVTVPLLLFIWGGTWLVDYMQWSQNLKIVCVILGVLVMMSSLISYLRQLIKTYGGDSKQQKSTKYYKRNCDYYYEKHEE